MGRTGFNPARGYCVLSKYLWPVDRDRLPGLLHSPGDTVLTWQQARLPSARQPRVLPGETCPGSCGLPSSPARLGVTVEMAPHTSGPDSPPPAPGSLPICPEYTRHVYSLTKLCSPSGQPPHSPFPRRGEHRDCSAPTPAPHFLRPPCGQAHPCDALSVSAQWK